MAQQINDYGLFYEGGEAGSLVLTEFKAPKDSDKESYGFGIIEVDTRRGEI